MRVFKPRYKNKRGKWTEVKKFWIEVVDRREQRFRKVLHFPTSERQGLAETLDWKIQKLINYAAMNEPDTKLFRWFQDCATIKVQGKLSDVGLLPKREIETERPLLDHLTKFHKVIFEESKDSPLPRQ